MREGQNINEPSQTMKNTALHIASKHGHVLIVKYLLKMGAVTNEPNLWGRTAIDMAKDSIDVLNS